MIKGSKSDLVPLHIGFIMDGNRRWAKKRMLPVAMGHQKGLEALEKIIEPCVGRGVKFVTFYSFSTENWNRTKEEVEGLMSLMLKALSEKSEVLNKKGAKVKVIGRTSDLPKKIKQGFEKLEDLTKKNNKINLAFAISYGGRAEIVDAIGKIGKKEISEDEIGANLYASDFPEPELIVRTGGMQRLSGFLMWQSIYSELYFLSTLWPDFNELELDKALEFYANQKRNFGK